MARVTLPFFIASAVFLACAGCGHAGSNEPDDGVTPERVMGEFLEAVRVGDDGKAGELLTPLARQKTAENDMVVAPEGSETAKYQVQGARYTATGAQVDTDWTDLDTDGRPHTDHIVWLLRKEKSGWRISGMVTKVFEEQAPIVLNFEDPAEMLAKQQQAEEEIARRERRESPQAKNLADEPTSSVR